MSSVNSAGRPLPIPPGGSTPPVQGTETQPDVSIANRTQTVSAPVLTAMPPIPQPKPFKTPQEQLASKAEQIQKGLPRLPPGKVPKPPPRSDSLKPKQPVTPPIKEVPLQTAPHQEKAPDFSRFQQHPASYDKEPHITTISHLKKQGLQLADKVKKFFKEQNISWETRSFKEAYEEDTLSLKNSIIGTRKLSPELLNLYGQAKKADLKFPNRIEAYKWINADGKVDPKLFKDAKKGFDFNKIAAESHFWIDNGDLHVGIKQGGKILPFNLSSLQKSDPDFFQVLLTYLHKSQPLKPKPELSPELQHLYSKAQTATLESPDWQQAYMWLDRANPDENTEIDPQIWTEAKNRFNRNLEPEESRFWTDNGSLFVAIKQNGQILPFNLSSIQKSDPDFFNFLNIYLLGSKEMKQKL